MYGKGKKMNVRCAATAGVKFWFKTNSRTLKLKFEMQEGSSRRYYSFDVFVNGKAVGYLDNFSNVQLPVDYTGVQLPLGRAEKEFVLGEGDKEVCVYFPWSVSPLLEEFSLEDGATVIPVKPGKKLLAFGDSITQGYDALRPSVSYISCLADKLQAELVNKAIGGEVFFPALAESKEDFTPDYITVAYGTNDWGTCEEAVFQENCKAFFAYLAANYPDAKIFAITPIWRLGYDVERKCGPFEGIAATIKEVTAAYENITVISGFDFVPKDQDYFADLRLHPNDKGFACYGDNLYDEICKIIAEGDPSLTTLPPIDSDT